jgi:putative membrane protein
MYRTFAALAAVLGLAIAPGLAAAGDATSGTDWKDDAPPKISAEDFLREAAAGNRFEIVTGRLAQEQAQSEEIKALGAEFVKDHTALLEKGAAVAEKLGISVPDELTPEQERAVARLERLSGKDFDRAWLSAQLDAHKAALKLNLRGAIRGEVPEIRMLAQGALPVVTHHLGALLDLVESYDHNDNEDDGASNHGNGGNDHRDRGVDRHDHDGHSHRDDDSR